MRRVTYRPYLFLILFLLSVMSLPQRSAERIRSTFVCSLAPFWRGINAMHSSSSPESEKLAQENQLLRSQIENVREWLLHEDRIQEQLQRYKEITHAALQDDFFKRRGEELCESLDLQIRSLPAKVIFREPSSWSSCLWINVGEKDNEKIGQTIVAKNSPVLLGTTIIGVIEHVDSRRSRVRLITDARLAPSVRAVRGKEQNRFLLEHLESLIFALQLRDDLFESPQGNEALAAQLHQLKNHLLQQSGNFYLAKGVLHGTGNPLWRSRGQVLRGVGFNYDFPDKESPSRDLRSAELLRQGDLLVTTGLDGVFPPGFKIAIVSSVQTLKEGASSYEIEAISTAGNLDELGSVFVLPPHF